MRHLVTTSHAAMALCLLAGIAAPAFAQSLRPAPLPPVRSIGVPSTLSGPLAVDVLVAHALAHNPEVRAARLTAQALGTRVPQVRSLPDPMLMSTAFLEEIQTAAGPQQVALSLSQKFPWFGKRALRSQVAYYDAMAAYSRVASTELKVVEEVKRAYYDLYFAQQAERETRQLQKPLEDVIAVARTKYETGSGKVGLETILQAQMELARLKIDLLALEQSRRRAQARLAGVLHLPAETPIAALDTLPAGNVSGEVETLIGLADTCQPAYAASSREVARDRASVDLARQEYWPDVTAAVNWYEMGEEGLSPVANGRDAFSLGVGINLPIYRGRLDAAVREAENKLCATVRRYESVRDQHQVEIESLSAQFREHDQTRKILESEIVPRAEETLGLVLESYRVDRASFQQWIDVYRTLLRYRIERHRHLALSQQALASLERAVGCAVTSQ